MTAEDIMLEIGTRTGTDWDMESMFTLMNTFISTNNLEDVFRAHCEAVAKIETCDRTFRVEVKYDSLMDVLSIPAPVRYASEEEWWPAVEIGRQLHEKLKKVMDAALGSGCYDYFYDGNDPDFDSKIADNGAYIFYAVCSLDSDDLASWQEQVEGDDDDGEDGMCDICMSSGVEIARTTSDGRSVCVDCDDDCEDEDEE